MGRTREMQNRFVQELHEAEQEEKAEQAARNPKRERDPSPGCEPESSDEDEHEQRKKARNAGLVLTAPIDAEQTTTAAPSLQRKRGDPVIIVPDSSESEPESEPESRPLLRRPHYQGVWEANKDLEAKIKSLQARCDELEAALECKAPRCIACLSEQVSVNWIHDGHTDNLCVECLNQSAEGEATYRAWRASW